MGGEEGLSCFQKLFFARWDVLMVDFKTRRSELRRFERYYTVQ